MSWTEERVELLTKLWAEGMSATAIASRLGQTTRNAVIGKVHRLALAGRPTPPRLKILRSRPRPAADRRLSRPRIGTIGGSALASLPAHHFEIEPFVAPAEELVIPPAERKTLQMLADRDCRWPIGDPQTPEFHFCNRHKVPGLPYCEFHARRAFQPPQPCRPVIEAGAVPAAVPVAAASPSNGQPVSPSAYEVMPSR